MTSSVPLCIYFLCLFFAVSALSAQSLPNSSFEDWTPSGSPPPFDWEEPTGWKSNNASTEFTQAGVRRSQTSHSGQYGVLIMTINAFGEDVPGMMANGNPKLDFSTYSLDLMTGGTPVTGRPSGLAGFYRFSSSSPGDSALAVVILKRYNELTSTNEVIGGGSYSLGPTDAYRSFEVPIVYQSEAIPDSVVVAFYSTSPISPVAGGQLNVDDIDLLFGSGVEGLMESIVTPRLSPSPVSDHVRITLPDNVSPSATIIFHDLLGRTVLAQEVRGIEVEVDIDFPEGLYLYRITGEKGEEFTGRMVVRR